MRCLHFLEYEFRCLFILLNYVVVGIIFVYFIIFGHMGNI